MFALAHIAFPNGLARFAKRYSAPDPTDVQPAIAEEQVREKALIKPLVDLISIPTSDKTNDYFRQKVFATIDYAIKRHDWYEEQRARLLQISITVITLNISAIAIIAKSNIIIDFSTVYLVSCVAIISLLSLVKLLYLYNIELDADRPYRNYSDIRWWYFRYNFQPASTNIPDQEWALKQRFLFFKRIEQCSTLEQSLREDLEQLFILQILQRYKSESLRQIRWAASYFYIFAAIEIVLFTLS